MGVGTIVFSHNSFLLLKVLQRSFEAPLSAVDQLRKEGYTVKSELRGSGYWLSISPLSEEEWREEQAGIVKAVDLRLFDSARRFLRRIRRQPVDKMPTTLQDLGFELSFQWAE